MLDTLFTKPNKIFLWKDAQKIEYLPNWVCKLISSFGHFKCDEVAKRSSSCVRVFFCEKDISRLPDAVARSIFLVLSKSIYVSIELGFAPDFNNFDCTKSLIFLISSKDGLKTLFSITSRKIDNDTPIDDIKGALKDKLEKNKELAIMSRTLGTILRDAPLEISINDLSIKEWDKEAVTNKFKELKFNRFIERFDLNGIGTPKVEKKVDKLLKIALKSSNPLRASLASHLTGNEWYRLLDIQKYQVKMNNHYQ